MAQLSLTVLRCPDYGSAEQRLVRGVELTIGRGTECDWALPDPLRSLSRKHCRLEQVGAAWQVVDLSANGTFINFASEAIGRDQAQPVRDGDRLRLGDYELEVRLLEPTTPGLGSPFDPALSTDPGGPVVSGRGGLGAPSDGGLFGAVPSSGGVPRSSAPGGIGGPPASGGFGAARLPGLDDPVEPTADAGSLDLDISGGLGGFPPQVDDVLSFGAQDDHAPSTGDAFQPPAVARDLPAAPAAPGQAIVPDDWLQSIALGVPAPSPPSSAFEFVPSPVPGPVPPTLAPGAQSPFGARPSGRETPPAAIAPLPAPTDSPAPDFVQSTSPGAFAPAWDEPVDVPLSGPRPATGERPDFDPFAEPAEPEKPDLAPAVPVHVPAPAPAPAHAPTLAPATERPPSAPPQRTAPPVRAAQPVPGAMVPPGGSADMLAALAVLMAGGSLPADTVHRSANDPEAALRQAGALMHAAVAGLRALLVARGLVKREFRIEQTMLRPKENNPLKFAASDEHALAALLDPRLDGLKALQDAVADLSSHEVAVLSATQAAAHALLDKLSPAALEAEDPGGGGLFGASAEKRLWTAYKRRHATLMAQLEDDFDSAFGIAFARAYERVVAKGKD
jgi:type VI secretion system FHA domain protein